MNTSQTSIVLDDQRISEALKSKDSFRLHRLIDLYRGSYDKDAFVATVMARLMLEHDRRLLAGAATTQGSAPPPPLQLPVFNTMLALVEAKKPLR